MRNLDSTTRVTLTLMIKACMHHSTCRHCDNKNHTVADKMPKGWIFILPRKFTHHNIKIQFVRIRDFPYQIFLYIYTGRFWLSVHIYTSWVKKDTKLLPIILHQMLTDFHSSFTANLSSKFATKLSLSIPPHLAYVATLPCEISVSENWQ